MVTARHKNAQLCTKTHKNAQFKHKIFFRQRIFWTGAAGSQESIMQFESWLALPEHKFSFVKLYYNEAAVRAR